MLSVMAFFVLVSISEMHHVIESIAERRYMPGTVTAIIWVAVGVMLGRAVLKGARTPMPLG